MPLREQLSRRPAPTGENKQLVVRLRYAIIVGLLLVLGFSYAIAVRNHVATDSETLCPTSGALLSSITVIILDMSDVFTEAQRLAVQNFLGTVQRTIPRFGLVEVYSVNGATEAVASPLLHLCNPGSGAELNRIYQNPEMAQRRWGEFDRKLNSELAGLMSSPDSQTSPIFEAVQATALRTFGLPGVESVPKHLVVVSDLMQNVPGRLSLYQGIPKFDEFEHTPYFSQIRANLEGVVVTLVYLTRPRTPQVWPTHYQFWEKYFLKQGATIDLLEPVYGAQ